MTDGNQTHKMTFCTYIHVRTYTLCCAESFNHISGSSSMFAVVNQTVVSESTNNLV